MEQAPIVREYREGDKEGIFALKQAVDKASFDEQQWNWKFENGPIRAAKIFVATSDDMIVGLRVFIIERLKIMSEFWTTALGVDIMVHPDFRHYGIAAKVAQEAFSRMSEEGIHILIGFPNEAAYRVYSRRRSHWRHVCSIPLLAKPLNIDSIFSKYIKNIFLQNLGKLPARIIYRTFLRERLHKANDLIPKRVYSFDNRFDDFWQEASRGYNIGLIRDKKFLNWRFIDKPGGEYVSFSTEKKGKILGYIVLKNAEMFNLSLGLIVDMLALTQDNVIDSLIAKAIEHFKDQKVDVVGCLMLNHTPYFRALKRAGFIVVPKALSHKEFYFGVQVKPSTISDKIINNPTNWFLTWGDTDLV